ncbi:MAG: hypothetical protein AAF544_03680, partial [Bacteroidota bacterium]
MNKRILLSILSFSCLFGSTSGQCLVAFPTSGSVGTCIGGGPDQLCVAEIPDSLDFEWVVYPGGDCTPEDYSGQTVIEFTPTANACGYGDNPIIAFSGGSGVHTSAQNPSACGAEDGWVQFGLSIPDSTYVTATRNGEPYLQDTFTQTYTFQDLPEGDYYFDIRVIPQWCRTTFRYTLQAPEANELDVDLLYNDFLCLGEQMDIDALVTGGTPPFQFAWSTGDSLNATINVGAPGQYSVTVTDLNGCQQSATAEVFDAPYLEVEGVVTNASCSGESNGSIDISVLWAEEEDVIFIWDDIGQVDNPDRTGLPAGEYRLTTISEFFCFSDWFFEVEQSADLEVIVEDPGSSSSVSYLCYGDSVELVADASGGSGTYTYSWSNGDEGQSIIVDTSGWYAVTVEDGAGCTTSDSRFVASNQWPLFNFELTQPDCGENNGSIAVSAETGESLLTYSWNTGESGPILDSISASIYELTVTRFGCDTTIIFDLKNTLIDLDILTPVGSIINCFQPSVTLEATLVGPQYAYAWLNENGDTLATSSSVEVAAGMTYQLYVTDTDLICTGFAVQLVEDQSYPVTAAPTFVPFESCESPAVIYAASSSQEELETLVNWPNGESFTLFAQDSLVLPLVGTYLVTVSSPARGCDSMYSFSVDQLGLECGYLDGFLYLTEDCNDPASGQLAPTYMVSLRREGSSNSPTLVPADENGYWRAYLEAGDYLIEAQPFSTELYQSCPAVAATLMPNQLGSAIDIGMLGLVDCAAPRVDVNIPLLRRCFNNPIYVSYFNDGPELLVDAQLVIELDSFMFYQSAEPAPNQLIDGYTLVYELGDLPVFSGGTITINAIVACSSVLGQNHCVQAQIPIDQPCPVPQNWAGASVGLSANCDEESEELRFDISNLSDAFDMTVPLSYVIVEDGLMLTPEPVESDALLADQTLELTLPANGSTYHLITNQEPNSPASPTPTIAVEGCGFNDDGTFSLFYINQISLSDEDVSWIDLECQNNIGSYDPNDKQAIPRGYDVEHYIDADQRIEYTIRFQNTGTDTAFNVVLRDTLSPELELTSFIPGAASHAYTYLIDSNRVLEVSFPNILLPDSSVSVLESQGA